VTWDARLNGELVSRFLVQFKREMDAPTPAALVHLDVAAATQLLTGVYAVCEDDIDKVAPNSAKESVCLSVCLSA
jgi:hypothetical protein